MKIAIALSLLVGVSAFTAPQSFGTKRVSFVRMAEDESEDGAKPEVEDDSEEDKKPDLSNAAGVFSEPAPYKCISRDEVLSSPNTIEFGKVWDPLGLGQLGSDETTAWFRHSEVKHGRIAMAAFVGWCVTAIGLRFPGELSHGLEFSSLSNRGLEAWDAVPLWGKVQFLLFFGLIEFHDELFYSRYSTHYLRGGVPGKNMVPGLYDPLNLWKNRSEEAKARGRDVEIKNGRLAMIGVAGMYFANVIPGSVPLQPPC